MKTLIFLMCIQPPVKHNLMAGAFIGISSTYQIKRPILGIAAGIGASVAKEYLDERHGVKASVQDAVVTSIGGVIGSVAVYGIRKSKLFKKKPIKQSIKF